MDANDTVEMVGTYMTGIDRDEDGSTRSWHP